MSKARFGGDRFRQSTLFSGLFLPIGTVELFERKRRQQMLQRRRRSEARRVANNLQWVAPPTAQAGKFDNLNGQPFARSLYEPVQLVAELTALAENDRIDGVKRTAALKRLQVNGPWRRCDMPGSAVTAVRDLAEEMPQFRAVCELVERRLMLAQAGQCSVRLPPILLLGPAGVGKSHFADKLAVCLQKPLYLCPFDSASSSATLAGMDQSWGSATTGLVFNALEAQEHANPVILLDELDKAGGRHHYDPLAPLHSLLEPVTARRFRDAFAGIEIDARWIVWLATANDVSTLSTALLSRFAIFKILPPSPGVMVALIQRMFRATVSEFGLDARIRGMSDEAVNLLLTASPRQARQQIEEALGAVILRGGDTVQASDFRAAALITRANPVGFLGRENKA